MQNVSLVLTIFQTWYRGWKLALFCSFCVWSQLVSQWLFLLTVALVCFSMTFSITLLTWLMRLIFLSFWHNYMSPFWREGDDEGFGQQCWPFTRLLDLIADNCKNMDHWFSSILDQLCRNVCQFQTPYYFSLFLLLLKLGHCHHLMILGILSCCCSVLVFSFLQWCSTYTSQFPRTPLSC